MWVLKAFVFWPLLAWCSAYNIEVKTKTVVKKGSNHSLFGFSISLHNGKGFADDASALLPMVFVGAPLGDSGGEDQGEVLQCTVNDNKPACKVFTLDRSNKKSYEHREKQWLGATVSSNGYGHLVTCAPRYSEIDEPTSSKPETQYYMIGKCSTTNEGSFPGNPLYPCTTLSKVKDDHDHERKTVEEQFCEAGFSAVIRRASKTLVIGAVGGKDEDNSSGAVIVQNDEGKKRFQFSSADAEGNERSEGFYLGYAVTYGNFYSKDSDDSDEEVIAASMPRKEYSGKVFVYSADLALVKEAISPPATVKQKEEYIYFGASLCAVDVNGDGYSDLIVGAPFYSDRGGGDEGRVYIYLSTETAGGKRHLIFSLSGRESIDPGLRGDNSRGARFGWAIAKAGDLNSDGIDDFIVGAPQDKPDIDGDGLGNGAIYIYHGRKDGKIENYKQKISAMTVENTFYPFRQFGSAISGNVDTNGDDYPDIAVGAWESDRVLVLRTRPVMHITARLTLSKKEIAVDNFTRDCTDGSGGQCLDAELCLSYQGKSVTGQHELKYTLEMDEEISLTASKRVYLLEDGTRIYEKTNEVTLSGKNQTACVNFSQIHVEEGNRLTEALRRGATDIVFVVKYELVSPSDCETTKLCPVLDDGQTPSISEKATLVFNCTDNTCDYDLKVNVSLDNNKVVIGSSDNVITATIELSNSDEVTYNPEVRITHDPSLQYEKITVVGKSFRIERRQVREDNTTTVSELFRLQGPLDRDKKVIFDVRYSTENVQGNRRELEISLKAIGGTGREKNEKDNNATARIYVEREVIMEISGTSLPRLLNYPASAPALNIKGEDNNRDYSSVNVSAIGPKVKVTFELENKGSSTLQNINLQITYPLKKHEGKDHDFVVYPIGIETNSVGSCKLDSLNPANLNLSTINTQSRRKREVETLKGRNSQPSDSFSCRIGELKEDRFAVDFEFLFWTATLVQYYAKDLSVEIQANASYKDSLTGKEHKEYGSVDIKLSPENPPGKSKSTPVWIIIVAVLGGILLLGIAIFALFKLGFFKRNRPPQDISNPETDDIPAVAAI